MKTNSNYGKSAKTTYFIFENILSHINLDSNILKLKYLPNIEYENPIP